MVAQLKSIECRANDDFDDESERWNEPFWFNPHSHSWAMFSRHLSDQHPLFWMIMTVFFAIVMMRSILVFWHVVGAILLARWEFGLAKSNLFVWSMSWTKRRWCKQKYLLLLSKSCYDDLKITKIAEASCSSCPWLLCSWSIPWIDFPVSCPVLAMLQTSLDKSFYSLMWVMQCSLGLIFVAGFHWVFSCDDKFFPRMNRRWFDYAHWPHKPGAACLMFFCLYFSLWPCFVCFYHSSFFMTHFKASYFLFFFSIQDVHTLPIGFSLWWSSFAAGNSHLDFEKVPMINDLYIRYS